MMKKTFIGSNKLKNNFKIFRIKYENLQEMEKIKIEVMDLMNEYLNHNGGILINVKELHNCNELVFYFVTKQQNQHHNWDDFLKNNLLKKYNMCGAVMELGPSY